MGSGLILLVIVGAWLAVLVPMALRGHDTAASLTSVDRFSDAMRVLSRRDGQGDRRYARSAGVLPRSVAPTLGPPAPAFALTAAERRRRTLLVLIGIALVSLGLAMAGVPLMAWLQALSDLLLAGFVVHLRQQAVRKAQRKAARTAHALPLESRPAAPERVAGIPDRMPRRPEPLTITLPAPAARYDDAPLDPGAWIPVPVPRPTYVGKAVAPGRPPRVLDLTKPGEWAAASEAELLDEGPELDEILERRRVSGGW